MELDLPQLRALQAVLTEGTFEAAARALHVTPSAISQRLRALEVATGRVLLVRSKPVQATESGRVLFRLARQIELLTSDTLLELEPNGADMATLPIAINADSLATWALPALASMADSACFEISREDEEHTASLLRAGTVVGAITADPEPVAGCSVSLLGSMRYRPMAAPAFAQRWFPDGPTADALARAPVLAFDRKDDLQHRYLRERVPGPSFPPTSYVPSTAELSTAVTLGMGWGMLPDLQRDADHDTRPLVQIDRSGAVEVALYWQQWKLRSALLDRVAEAIHGAAAASLVR